MSQRKSEATFLDDDAEDDDARHNLIKHAPNFKPLIKKAQYVAKKTLLGLFIRPLELSLS